MFDCWSSNMAQLLTRQDIEQLRKFFFSFGSIWTFSACPLSSWTGNVHFGLAGKSDILYQFRMRRSMVDSYRVGISLLKLHRSSGKANISFFLKLFNVSKGGFPWTNFNDIIISWSVKFLYKTLFLIRYFFQQN